MGKVAIMLQPFLFVVYIKFCDFFDVFYERKKTIVFDWRIVG